MSHVATVAMVRGVVAPASKNAFARWLVERRTARYRTQADALAAIRQLTGVAIHQSEYGQWEGGSRVPRDDNPKVQALYAVFGKPPEADATAHTDAVAAAIAAQTKAITEAMDRQTDALVALAKALEGLADVTHEGQGELSERIGSVETLVRGLHVQ